MKRRGNLRQKAMPMEVEDLAPVPFENVIGRSRYVGANGWIYSALYADNERNFLYRRIYHCIYPSQDHTGASKSRKRRRSSQVKNKVKWLKRPMHFGLALLANPQSLQSAQPLHSLPILRRRLTVSQPVKSKSILMRKVDGLTKE